MTGSSAHCMARCRIEVPSVRALGSWSEVRLSSPSAGGDCSLMAFEMAVVSPLRSASKTRKSFTLCSIDEPVGVAMCCEGCEGDEGLKASWCGAAVVAMLVETCGGRCGFAMVRWARGCGCPDDDDGGRGWASEAADELAGEGGSMAMLLVVLLLSSVLERVRLRAFLTLLDLERLCLAGGDWLSVGSTSHGR